VDTVIADLPADKTLYVVSDLHMGDGSQKDNFAEYRGRFEDFLRTVVDKDPSARLILAGDVFEFWQSEHGDIVKCYLDLLRDLFRREPVFIVGNHDIDLFGFIGLKLDLSLVRLLVKDLTIERGSSRIRICHGYEFDRFNDPKKALILGRISAILAGWVEEKVGTKVGQETTETLLEQLAKGIMAFGMRWYRNHFNKTSGEKVESGKKIDEVQEALDTFHAENPGLHVVAGHTHQAGRYGDWYVNSGAWQGDQANYVKITLDGSISLHKWPGQEEVELQLWRQAATGA